MPSFNERLRAAEKEKAARDHDVAMAKKRGEDAAAEAERLEEEAEQKRIDAIRESQEFRLLSNFVEGADFQLAIKLYSQHLVKGLGIPSYFYPRFNFSADNDLGFSCQVSIRNMIIYGASDNEETKYTEIDVSIVKKGEDLSLIISMTDMDGESQLFGPDEFFDYLARKIKNLQIK